MKTKMWFLTSMILILSICMCFFISCQDTTSNVPINVPQNSNPYSEVGVLHNSAFAYVFEGLKTDKLNHWNPANKADLENKIINHLNDFNRKMNMNYGDELYLIVNEHSVNKLSKSSLFDEITPRQQYYLDKIDNLIFNVPELNELQKKISDLDAEVIASFNEIEAAPILSKSSVALASKTYWVENFQGWLETITSANHLNKNAVLIPENIFERLAYADAAGAAAGAFYAIVSGQWYAITGMAATGAAYGTAIEAIVILYEILSEL